MPALGSVLVIRLSSLGDVLFAVPAVQALQRSGLAERVTWLVEDRAAGLLALASGLSEVMVYPRSRPALWLAHAAALRRRRDDLVIDLQGNLKSRAQLMLLRAPRKLGFDRPIAREGSHRALTERFVPTYASRHRVASHRALIGTLAPLPPGPAPRPDLHIAPAAAERARTWLDDQAGDGPLIVLHPGTSAFGALKRWAPAQFGALGDRLTQEHDARLLITAGPAEAELAQQVQANLATRALRPPPGTLPDLAALLAAADLVIAADSFPLHLANALGTPVVGLYGPKSPNVTGPYWDRSEVVTAGVDCSPCTLRRCSDRICMERLDVESVQGAAARLLATPRTHS